MLGHVPLFVGCFAKKEELLSNLWSLMIFQGMEEKRGLAGEK